MTTLCRICGSPGIIQPPGLCTWCTINVANWRGTDYYDLDAVARQVVIDAWLEKGKP